MRENSRRTSLYVQIANCVILLVFSAIQCFGKEPITALEEALKYEDIHCVAIIHDNALWKLQESVIFKDVPLVMFSADEINNHPETCNVIVVWLQEIETVTRLFQRVQFKKTHAHFVWLKPPNANGTYPQFLREVPRLSVIDPDTFEVSRKTLCSSNPVLGRHSTPDISCLTLRATTFEYPPFITVEKDASGSVASFGGIEVSTAESSWSFRVIISKVFSFPGQHFQGTSSKVWVCLPDPPSYRWR